VGRICEKVGFNFYTGSERATGLLMMTAVNQWRKMKRKKAEKNFNAPFSHDIIQNTGEAYEFLYSRLV